MPGVVSTLRRGNAVQLSYRHKIIGTIQPPSREDRSLRRGSPEAILEFLDHADFGVPEELRRSNKSVKEEIAELRDRDLSES